MVGFGGCRAVITTFERKLVIPSNFIYLGLCFNVLGTGLYLRKALRNEVQPNLVTFVFWALAPMLAFAAQFSKGVGLVSLPTLVVGVNPAIILLVSLRSPTAHWSIRRFDVTCGLISLVGLLAWWHFRDATYAIVLAIMSDALASVPTFRKSLSNPESESPVLYLCTGVSAGIALLTIQMWEFDHYIFAAYLLCLSLSLAAVLIASGVRHKKLNSDGSGGTA
jgi:hypothetical protein